MARGVPYDTVSSSSPSKKLTPENLAADFIQESALARQAIKTLYLKLVEPRTARTRDLFAEWMKIVSNVYPRFDEEIEKIADIYDLTGNVDGGRLFLAIQTYYAILLKLVAVEVAFRFSGDGSHSLLDYLRRIEDPAGFKEAFTGLESGELFKKLGIRGFTERDLLSWYLDEWDEDIEGLLRAIVGKLSTYDMSSLSLDVGSARDMFKILYEELIPRTEIRKKLGIYLTPDWLAELVIKESGLEEKLSDPCNVRVLDPACGTGTFLSLVLQKIGERATPSWEALRCVTMNVVGFDIEPLAVLTAKTNYLIALAATGLLSHKQGEIEIPVFMANSLLPAEHGGTVLGGAPVIRIELPTGVFLIPKTLVDNGVVDSFLEDVVHAVNHGVSIDAVAGKYGLAGAEAALARELYDKLIKLKEEGRESVWVSLVKSILAPYRFLGYFDYIVGNPPWMTYGNIADPDYRALVKHLTMKVYRLVTEALYTANMELATLFLVRTADLYLKDNGVIGVVMPRSVLNMTQHEAFRRGAYSRVKLKIEEIIDCASVEPLFPVPTSVIIARKGESTVYPVRGLLVRGKPPKDRHKVITLDEARSYLEFRNTIFYYNKIGSKTFLYTENIGFTGRRSPYYRLFQSGAPIKPRVFWFVDIVDASQPDIVVVQSARRGVENGKMKAWIPAMPVEREFIYGVITSNEVLPFTHLRPFPSVLPLRRRRDRYEIITREQALKQGYRYLAGWLAEVERLYKEIWGKEDVDLHYLINYRRGLTNQSLAKRYRVVLVDTATHPTAAVVENTSLFHVFDMGWVRLNGIVVENKLFYYETNNAEEAYYLVSLINSRFIDKAIMPMHGVGYHARRHIMKRPFELPIPLYNHDNSLHRELARLGREAVMRSRKLLPHLLKTLGYDAALRERGYLKTHEMGQLRGAIRDALKDLLDKIDEITPIIINNHKDKEEGILKWIQ